MEKAKINRLEEYKTSEDINNRRPSYLEIDLSAFKRNFGRIKSLAGAHTSVMAVVKANAYGHGLVRIGKYVSGLGADLLGVAFVEEAFKLQAAGIKKPIVVLYPDTLERASMLVQAGLIATVDSVEYLKALSKEAKYINKSIDIFIKVETGMGRYGATESELPELVSVAADLPNINIIGLTTNLADSSNGDTSFTDNQFAQFKSLSDSCNLNGVKYLSIENSSGLLFHHHSYYNLVRVGLVMYGYSPKNSGLDNFEPVMSLKSRVIQLRQWPAGKPVGYGGKYTPSEDILLATIGVGYADGYPWALSNKSEVLIRGQRAPVVGRVCMDALMVDVSRIPDVVKGDEVVLIGRSGDEFIDADELGELAGSFSYEILAGMSERLPRVYVGG